MAGNTPPRLRQAEKDRRALELRLGGYTYQGIADEIGWSHKSQALRAVDREVKRNNELMNASREQVLALEVARLDALLKGHWMKALEGDDKATKNVLRIMDRRARYYGLDRNESVQADAAYGIAAAVSANSLPHSVAAQVVAVVLALADRLHFSAEQRADAPAALMAELESRGLVDADPVVTGDAVAV